jgi:hypothetical protein
VRALLTKSEQERYYALMDVGHYLEEQKRYDLVYTVQKEIDYLVQPAIERLKEKSRERDRMTKEYLEAKAKAGEEAGQDQELPEQS